MKIAFLINGPSDNGLHRYAKMLMETARLHGDTIVPVYLDFSESCSSSRLSTIRQAVETANKSDCCYMQFNYDVWGGTMQARENLSVLLDGINRPVATTLHDLQYVPGFSRPSFFPWLGSIVRESFGGGVKLGSSKRRSQAFSVLAEKCSALFVFNDRERAFMSECGIANKTHLVRHFVEDLAPHLPDYKLARSKLGIASSTVVVTLLGFIHRRKGHHILLETARHLVFNDYRIVFAGGCNNPRYLNQLKALADKHGILDRLDITGFLPFEEQILYLASSDVAVCPFRSMAASGSLSTWIAAGVPIVGSDLPEIQEYNRLSAGSIFCAACDPSALAHAIDLARGVDKSRYRMAIDLLRSQLSMSTIWQQHADVFAQIAD